jgi:hypothetical protein
VSVAIVTLLILIGIAYAIAVIKWWPILDDPDHYTRERIEDLIEHFRYFRNLPRPDRKWNK